MNSLMVIEAPTFFHQNFNYENHSHTKAISNRLVHIAPFRANGKLDTDQRRITTALLQRADVLFH